MTSQEDQVAGIWLKRIKSVKHHYKEHLINLFKSKAESPEWLLTSKMFLLPKNEITSQAKNYLPIALQNKMYKMHTALLVEFIMNHCEKNGIVWRSRQCENVEAGGIVTNF